MRFPRHLAVLLCFAFTGAGAAWGASSIRIDNSVTGSTTGIGTSSTTSTSSTSSSTTATTTSEGGGRAVGKTSCSMNSRGRRCETSCSAPKVAHCVQASAEQVPRCDCR